MNKIVSPFFSIVCPIYNSELFLEECINSVINQTYSNWELILIDDGSTDNSYNICNKFSKLYKKIKIYKSFHEGSFSARNNGIKYSTGKYILFIDSDDYFDLNALEICYKKITEFNYPDLLTYYYSIIHKDSTKEKYIYKYDVEFNSIISDSKKIFEFCVFPNDISALYVKAIKRNLAIKALKYCLQEYNTKEISKLRYREDYFLSFFIVINCKTLLMINDYIYNYRFNPKSVTHNINYKDYVDCYSIEQIVYNYAISNNLFNEHNQILFKRKLCENICRIIKYYVLKKFKLFSFDIIKIRNNDFFIKELEHFNFSSNNKNFKIIFKLFIEKKFFLLWLLVNLNYFKLTVLKRKL